MRRNSLLAFTALCVTAVVAAAPATAAPSLPWTKGATVEQTQPGRLPAEAVPLHYDIAVSVDKDKLAFNGHAEITFQARRPISTLTLNAADLAFGRVTVDGKPVATPAIDATQETATFRFGAPLKARSEEHTSELQSH